MNVKTAKQTKTAPRTAKGLRPRTGVKVGAFATWNIPYVGDGGFTAVQNYG